MKRHAKSSVEYFPLWLLLVFAVMVFAISQSPIQVREESLTLVETVTLSFIGINISLLLFILPSLAAKRDETKQKNEDITPLRQVVNMVIMQNICSFVLFLISLFASIFIVEVRLKFAFLISSLLIQASYFLNMLLWLGFIYWQREEKGELPVKNTKKL